MSAGQGAHMPPEWPCLGWITVATHPRQLFFAVVRQPAHVSSERLSIGGLRGSPTTVLFACPQSRGFLPLKPTDRSRIS